MLTRKMEKIDISKNRPPQGYNSLEKIRGALYHWICVPFKKIPVWCLLKCLSYMELKSCGDISCLYLKKENESKKTEEEIINEIIEIKNIQEAICQLAFVDPSYNRIIQEITGIEFFILEKQQELKKINEQIKLLKGKDREIAKKRSLQIEYQIGFLLPDDTMSFVTAWSLGIEVTDIKKVSRNILFDAAIMAKHWGKMPSDMIDGVFTEQNKHDINRWGTILYEEHIEDMKRKKRLRKNNYQWRVDNK